jgi:GxxExxY protein
VELTVCYKDQRLATSYRAGFVWYETVVVELKALAKLTGIEQAQITNYLKVTGLETGLLINFGAKSLAYRRFVYSKVKPARSV